MDLKTRIKIEGFIRKSLEQEVPSEEIIKRLEKAGVTQEISEYLLNRVELENFFIYDENRLVQEQKRIEKAQEEFRKGSSLNVTDFMSFPVQTIEENDPLPKAVKLMAEKNIGSLVVLNNEKPIGIMSERDLLKKVLAKDADYRKMLVKDVMTPHVICASIKEKLIEVETKMKVHHIRRIPILDGEKLVGIITATDIIRIMAFI